MRRLVVIFNLAFFAFAAALALVNAIETENRDCQTVTGAVNYTHGPTPKPIPTQPGWETVTFIPLYPNAEWVHEVEIRDPSDTARYLPGTIRIVGFVTSDPVEQVDAFYRDFLLRQGWTTSGPGYSRRYKCLDRDGPMPWGLTMTVETTERVVGGTDVHLDINRWPNVDKIPLYPGAQQVLVKSVPPPRSRMQVRVTTYVTDARPDELERYYRPILDKHFWRVDEKLQGPIDTTPGIVYHHWYAGLPGPKGANLYVFAQPQPDGLTKVELKVEEFDWYPNVDIAF